MAAATPEFPPARTRHSALLATGEFVARIASIVIGRWVAELLGIG